MGDLTERKSAGPDYGGVPAPKEPSFMDHLGAYLTQKYPIAGGIASAALGGQQASSPPPMAEAPVMTMPGGQTPDFSMLQQNAQPKKSGFMDLVKALIGGG